MRLDDQVKIWHSPCFICNNAGKVWELWPLQVSGGPHPGSFVWNIYCKDLVAGTGSNMRNRPMCPDHHEMFMTEWEHIAQIEVDLSRAHDAWIERTET